MITTKKRYEAPRAQLIQFEGNDILTTSSDYYFSCEDGIKGNYRDWSACDITYISDNSLDT